MLVALSVIGENAAALGLQGYKVFDERGGTIGRLSTNDWVLQDPKHLISAVHARIEYRGNRYYLEDTSTNGTFVNDPGLPIQKEVPVALSDGDRIFIGSFEIFVQAIDDLPVFIAGDAPLKLGELPSVRINDTGRHPEPSIAMNSRAPATRSTGTSDRSAQALRSLAMQIDASLSALNVHPDDMPATLRALSSEAEGCGGSDLNGDVLRDLQTHEAAMLAGIRAGFDALISSFDPERLEALYGQRLPAFSNALEERSARAAQYWEMLGAQFQLINEEPEAHFILLFAERFAEAYAARVRESSASQSDDDEDRYPSG